MQHPSLTRWEDKLDEMIKKVDKYLEDKHGHKFKLHPARPRRGETGNPRSNGLFGVSANFSLGLGSEKGKGYIIDVNMVTLENVPIEEQEDIEQEAMEKINELLPTFFPDAELSASRDGNVIKIHGDISLGNV